MFDVSRSTVSIVIHSVIPILWRFFLGWGCVAVHSRVEYDEGRMAFISADAVGCIDETPHEIYRPKVEPQSQFYSGHGNYYLMNTQLVVDIHGNIVFLQAGSLGAMNDAVNFILMPPGAVLLADQGYGDTVPLLTPFRDAQIRPIANTLPSMCTQIQPQVSKVRCNRGA